MASNHDGSERREFERVELDEPGIIVFPNGKTRVPCQLVNKSEGGVLVKVDAEEKLPTEFTLIFGDPVTEIVCRIAWRIGTRTGCEFIYHHTDVGADNDYVLPIQSDSTEMVIQSRLLKHPLIIS